MLEGDTRAEYKECTECAKCKEEKELKDNSDNLSTVGGVFKRIILTKGSTKQTETAAEYLDGLKEKKQTSLYEKIVYDMQEIVDVMEIELEKCEVVYQEENKDLSSKNQKDVLLEVLFS